MVRTGSRAHINSDGMAPLADTTSGAQGAVLGTERSRLQQLWSAVGGVVDTIAGIVNVLYTRQLYLRPSIDRPSEQIVQSLNAANSLVNWSITQNGVATGISLSQVGSVQEASASGAAGASAAAGALIMSLTLPAGGVWAVSVSARGQGSGFGITTYLDGAAKRPVLYASAGSQTMSIPPFVATGGQSITVYNDASGAAVTFLANDTIIRAIRIG